MNSDSCQEQQGGGIPNWALAALISAMVALIAGGAWFYSLQEQELKHGAEADLASIARFKVEQIENWQRERLGDAYVLMESPYFAQGVERFLKNSHATDERDLRQRLQSFKNHYLYQDILLVDAEGEVRLELSEHKYLRQELGQTLAHAFIERRPVFTDIHTDADDDDPHVSIVVPLFSSQASSARLLGAVVLLMPAKQYLFPLLQTWPTHSRTAETFLVRREGDHALFLNDLRHQPGTALKLKIPLSQTDDPAATAILGSRGLARGHDYRGHDVLAFSIEIPGTAWIMVSKMDTDEVYLAWRRQSLLIFTLVAFFLTGLGGAALLLWQHKQKEFFQTRFLAEARLRESLELQSITLSSIGDGVICTDAQGRVTLLNPVAQRLTGWSLEEARGKMLDEVFRIINEETRQPLQNPVARVLAEGITLTLANHTMLISAEGSELPIADSAAPIRKDCGEIIGVVLVFRDYSAERMAEKSKEALHATEMRYRELVESARSIIVKVDTSGHITFFNEFAQSIYGFTEQEIVGRHLIGTIVPEQDSYSLDMRGLIETILAKPDEHLLVESETIRRDGSRLWVSWSNKPLYDENGQLLGILSVGADITERKAYELELLKLRHGIENSTATIVITDGNGVIEYVNPAFTATTGYTPEEAIGQNPSVASSKLIYIQAASGLPV